MTTWIDKFNTPPEGYEFRQYHPSDGVEIEEVLFDVFGGTMTKDGKPVAYAGFSTIQNRLWASFYIQDQNIRNHGMWLIRLIRESLNMVRDGGAIEVYVLCDTRMPNAEAFLRVLGFKPMKAMEKPSDIILYEGLMGGFKAWRLRFEEK